MYKHDKIKEYSLYNHNFQKVIDKKNNVYFFKLGNQPGRNIIKISSKIESDGRSVLDNLFIDNDNLIIYEVDYNTKTFYEYFISNPRIKNELPVITITVYEIKNIYNYNVEVEFLSYIREEFDEIPDLLLEELKNNALKDDLEVFQKTLSY